MILPTLVRKEKLTSAENERVEENRLTVITSRYFNIFYISFSY